MEDRRYQRTLHIALLCLLGILLICVSARAENADDDQLSVDFHVRDTYTQMPVKHIAIRTTVHGPLAQTTITYIVKNDNSENIEAVMDLHVGPDTVLTGFGYNYRGRFIPGKMYDKDKAWKIYEAVTSRGRDPGIMDRPTLQDYHTQIFPVEANKDLRVVINLVQVLPASHSRRRRAPALSTYSGFVRKGDGYFVIACTTRRALEDVRIHLHPATRDCLPTAISSVGMNERFYIAGRYRRAERLSLTITSRNHRPIHLSTYLSGRRIRVHDNAAAAIWADKRIEALENAPGPDRRPEIIALSQRFTVISSCTALLAIPQEELENYKKRAAAEKVKTNTQYTGGGGGDPYIEVKAPADSRQVTAILPDGDIIDLAYDAVKRAWCGRFDLPLGTSEGEYGVTVIIVHPDGLRTRFTLLYNHLKTGPDAGLAENLSARAGEAVRVRIKGDGIARATAIAPWGERINLLAAGGAWAGSLSVPASWPAGHSAATVILLDGAHNRTEVSLDLETR